MIGPEIPAHLLQNTKNSDDDDVDEGETGAQGEENVPSIGPAIPAHLSRQSSVKVNIIDDDADGDEDEDEDDGPQPAPPPSVNKPQDRAPQRGPAPSASRSSPAGAGAGVSRPTPGPSTARQIGPSFPTYAPTYDPNTYADDDEDSDEDIGPKPLPAGMTHEEPDAVKRFIEREERQKKLAEEAAKPKAAKRDEWMIVPPTSTGLLGSLDPSKLSKPRQFSKGTAPAATAAKDMTLWTETPQERQQRLADEVSGKKRRVTEVAVDPVVEAANKRRRQEEEKMRKQVEDYNKSRRGPALIDQHGAKEKADEKPAIWDHARDMGLGGRLMDDGKRKQVLNEAKSLNERFQSSKFS